MVGVFEDEGVAHDLPGGTLEAMLDSGEAQRKFKRLAVTHADGRRYILIGLGDRTEFDAERARSPRASPITAAAELGTDTLCWEVPHHVGDEIVAGLVEGTVLRAYRFDRYKGDDDDGADRTVQRLLLSAHHDISEPVRVAAIIVAAQNRARDLGNTPSNDLSPDRARRLRPGEPPSGSESRPRCSTRTRSVRWGWARSPRSHRARSRALG